MEEGRVQIMIKKKKQNSFLFGEEAIIELNFRVTHFSFFLKIFLRGL